MPVAQFPQDALVLESVSAIATPVDAAINDLGTFAATLGSWAYGQLHSNIDQVRILVAQAASPAVPLNALDATAALMGSYAQTGLQSRTQAIRLLL